MNWLKSLFGMADNTTDSFRRTEMAWKDIADMSEQVRDALQNRFALPDKPKDKKKAIADK